MAPLQASAFVVLGTEVLYPAALADSGYPITKKGRTVCDPFLCMAPPAGLEPATQ